MKFFLLSALLFCSGAVAAGGGGWGDNVNWAPSLANALEQAAATQKPIVAIISKSYCGACKALKPLIAASSAFAQVANSDFIAVSLTDDDEPKGAEYAPDGGYIPRVLFLSPEGKVEKSLINAGRKGAQYQFFYTDAESLVQTMNEATSFFKKSGVAADKEDM